MELILGAAFLAVARMYADAALHVTSKIIDLFNVTAMLFKYISAAFVSAAMVLVTKYVGVGTLWILLAMLGFTGGQPDFPEGMKIPWAYWGTLFVLIFLYSGGIYDWKKLQQRKSLGQ